MLENTARETRIGWDSPWGRFVPGIIRARPGPRVLAFTSFDFGRRALEELVRMHHRNAINLVGVCTDDALDPDAKISKQRRTWRYLSPIAVEATQRGTEKLALDARIPLYTGKIRTRFFIEHLLPAMRPDIIVMYGFGQVIPPEVFDYPPWGMYNLHPSDLARGLYPGADPFGDMARDGATSTKVTMHHVNEEVDGGAIVATSPSVPLPLHFEPSPEKLGVAFARIAPLGPALVRDLIHEATRARAPVYHLAQRLRKVEPKPTRKPGYAPFT